VKYLTDLILNNALARRAREKQGSSAVMLAIMFVGFAICIAGAIGVCRQIVVNSECETFGRVWTKAILSEYDVHLLEDYSLMAYFGNDVFDLYLGGGFGYSVFYPQLGTAAADYGHSLGAVGLFESAWFASGNAGLRFMLNETLSIGAEVNYRYLIPAEKHSASGDIVFGISL
jgi:hypothetical protein